ncbi:MAG: beta-propeller domain-containing protein [Clostridia bacterium]|nr:beta-propeller domain-containing protein [Clostridia bacterium]
MKEQDIFNAIGNAPHDMVAAADLKPYVKAIKRRRFTVFAACVAIFTVFFSLWLFLPFSGELEDLSRYSDSEYYGLMLKVQELACRPDNYRYRNNADKYFGTHEQFDVGIITTGTLMPTISADKYEEVTDNQFEGIIEGDLFKRSDKAIFYLDPLTLILYSYSTDDAVLLDSINIPAEFGFSVDSVYFYNSVIYLSPDCRSVSVVLPSYQKTLAVSVDVSAPEDMKKGGYFEISGGYITSRMIEGKLLTVTGWGLEPEPDFSKESAYLPQITWNGETHSLAAEDIVYTEDAWRPFYTVMALLDMNSLEVVDSAAVLDYAGAVTVSENNVFLSCYFSERSQKPGEKEGETLHKIVHRSTVYAVSHRGGKLDIIGNVKVDGTPIDQYAMDEYDGMLRIVTETFMTEYIRTEADAYSLGGATIDRLESADLYCIDLETFEIIGSVKAFSPDGEEVTSVRFEENMAYVCTAERKYFSDPVYFFDLSDPANITFSDTGVIDGYSTSLVDMGEGKLLGIGYGDGNNVLKVEVYEEKGDKVVSVCAFELDNVVFSEDYKSYYINRADGLVGLMVSREYASEYILLKFDGNRITQIASVTLSHVVNESYARATVIDGRLFVFAEDVFKFIKIDQ